MACLAATLAASVPSRSAVGLALLLGPCLLPGCEREEPAAPPPAAAAPAEPPPSVRFLDASFADVYQIFLRRNLSTQEKMQLWATHYGDHWVRWTGELVALSATGVKMRQIASTLTFDVSVIIDEPQRSRLRARLRPKKFYSYVGRLDHFDDLFRTIYLDHGAILDPNPAGVAGQLIPVPRPVRMIPVDQPAPARPGGKTGGPP